MIRICGWCDKVLGVKEGEGITVGICHKCHVEILTAAGKQNQIMNEFPEENSLTNRPDHAIIIRETYPIGV